MFTIKYTLKEKNGPYTRFIVPRKIVGETEIVGDQVQAREIWKKLLISRSVNGEAVDFIHTALIYGGTIKDKNTVIEFRICEKMSIMGSDPIIVWNPEPLPVERKGEEPDEIVVGITGTKDVDILPEVKKAILNDDQLIEAGPAFRDIGKPKRVRKPKAKPE